MHIRFALVFTLGICSLSAQACAEAKNAILFIGDGMGLAQVTAARIYQENARDGKLTLDTFDRVALVRTYSANYMTSDSAAAGTALATGVKTDIGKVAVDPDNNDLETVLEKAKRAGKSVGVITTTTLTHATPACFYAHHPTRANEAALAAQLIDKGIVDVAMGGGREYFVPRSTPVPESGGRSGRKDERDLIAEASAKGFRVIQRHSELYDLMVELDTGSAKVGPVLALFEDGHMSYEAHRENDTWGEPSISEMTSAAIKLLSRNPNGYFLMVEGGRIDHAGHRNSGQLMVRDLLAFDEAIRTGRDMSGDDTLIVITADHETGGLAINGYAPIEVGGEEMFRAKAGPGGDHILTWASGPGAVREKETRERDDPDYTQPALIPNSSAAHTGIDVIAWASGPGSERVKGTVTNADLGAIVIESLGLK